MTSNVVVKVTGAVDSALSSILAATRLRTVVTGTCRDPATPGSMGAAVARVAGVAVRTSHSRMRPVLPLPSS